MDRELLEMTASELVAPGKGILAADESNGTMSNRLAAVGVEPSSETRRSYRANLFATPGYESAVGGVILFDETMRQNMDDGTPIPDALMARESTPESRSIQGLRTSPITPVRRSQRALTACVSAAPSTFRWVRASPSGAL